MKTIILLVALVSQVVHAQTPNDKIVADFMSNYVYQISQPVYVWNWFNANGHDKIWTSKLSATSSAGYDHLVSGASKYWESLCGKDTSLNPPDCPKTPSSDIALGTGNSYGPGLYFALDPVATRSYGGGQNTGWVLMQLHLPKGLLVMDLSRDGNQQAPLKVQRAMIALGCPKEMIAAGQMQFGNFFFGMNNYNATNGFTDSSGKHIAIPDQCILSVRKILKDDLQIDAFVYGYSSTEFKECDQPVSPQYYDQESGNNPNRSAAMVLLNAKKFTAQDVRVFNAQTPDDKEDRLRIETLFYKADVESKTVRYKNYFGANGIPGYPGYQYSGNYSNCSSDSTGKYTCAMQITICQVNGGNCQQIDAPAVPDVTMSAIISAKNPPKVTEEYWYSGGQPTLQPGYLHWKDLDGVPVDATVNTWIVDNLFGCKADPEYN
jgi:hypothetical protein